MLQVPHLLAGTAVQIAQSLNKLREQHSVVVDRNKIGSSVLLLFILREDTPRYSKLSIKQNVCQLSYPRQNVDERAVKR